jgi:hypothetical protein
MRNILETVLIGLMLTDSGGTVRAGPFDDGVAAYQRGDFATALRLFRHAQLAARRRDTIQKGLSPAQLVRAQEMARQCEARKFKGCD